MGQTWVGEWFGRLMPLVESGSREVFQFSGVVRRPIAVGLPACRAQLNEGRRGREVDFPPAPPLMMPADRASGHRRRGAASDAGTL